VEIVVKGRNVEVPDHYRLHVSEKLAKVERYDSKIIRVDIELFHERNPRQSGRCQRIEITCVSRGPVVRAEACAGDFYSALDLAITKLDGRLRRMADRRRVHRGRRAPVSVAAATSGLGHLAPDDVFAQPSSALTGGAQSGDLSRRVGQVRNDQLAEAGGAQSGDLSRRVGQVRNDQLAEPDTDHPLGAEPDDQPWHIVREKEHEAEPMTVDDALFQMELVGHDFYLFMDKDSGRPSVVYRRRAYDYGVISLTA
jgi:ribosomal subunit interface protein